MNKAYDCALRLLARREHSAFELATKLRYKGFNKADVALAVEQCQHLGYQDDRRFVESFVRTRISQGYGPQRILQELLAKKISRELIESFLSEYQPDCHAVLERLLAKKFGNEMDDSMRQKEIRKLLYRGFSIEMIKDVLNNH